MAVGHGFRGLKISVLLTSKGKSSDSRSNLDGSGGDKLGARGER